MIHINDVMKSMSEALLTHNYKQKSLDVKDYKKSSQNYLISFTFFKRSHVLLEEHVAKANKKNTRN